MKKIDLIKLGMVVGVFVLSYFCLFLTSAISQEIYPSKDITFICASNPGGGTDIAARGMAPFFSKYLKELSPGAKGGDMKVKNIPGASHEKAMISLNESKPDGYTIGDFIGGNIYKFNYGDTKLPFDVREFSWLFCTGEQQRILICNKKKFATWEEMIAASKKEPLILICSSVGSSQHLETIFLKELVKIPGKLAFSGGTSASVSAIMRGDGDVSLVSYDSVSALVESKEVNVLMTVTRERLLPQAPTIKEKGFPDALKYIGSRSSNRMVIGPPKLDPEPKQKILAALKKMVADPGYQAFCQKTGTKLDPVFGEDLRGEVVEYAKFLDEMAPTLKKYGL